MVPNRCVRCTLCVPNSRTGFGNRGVLMKQKKKRHFDRATKAARLYKETTLGWKEDCDLAKILDDCTFAGLQKIAKTISIFAKGL